MDSISDNNPDLDEMKERGWAWVQRSLTAKGTYKYGAPYADDEYARKAVKRLHENNERAAQNHEIVIVSWD